MSWPAIYRIRLAHHKARRRVALRLFAVVVALIALLPVAQPAQADTVLTDACLPLSGAACAYQPPALLNLSGLYSASGAQIQSLQNLETTAISNTLTEHGLPATDRIAVQSWGRSSAEAELYGLIEQAVATAPSARTADQQNAADWIASIEQREAVTAAKDAGLEYAKWAGLDQFAYQRLVFPAQNSQSDIQAFLSTTPEGALNYGGFCSYRAPAPYSSEYDPITNAALCDEPGGGLGCIFSCAPNTPSYDQFVKWGEADASNASLSSGQTELAASRIAAGLIFGGVAAGARVGAAAAGTGLASALIGTALQEAILPYAAVVGYGADEAVATAVATTEIASSVGVITGILIVAITTAVVEGIAIANDAALPGKLAALIANAEATPPDPAALLNNANGTQSLFSLFAGATLPDPASGTCAGCLNAPAIPQPAFSDPYFIDTDTYIPGTQVGSSSYTQTPSGPTTHTTTNAITVADYTRGVTETARLTGHWFVLQPDGSAAPTQSLSIAYTDWDGRQQVAWLVGNLTDGYQFVGYDATDGKNRGLDPATCLASHICWKFPFLDYVGVDGNLHEATVQTPSAATATVSYHDAFQNQPFAAYEGDPEIFAVTNPDPTLDYTWEFEQTPPCPGPAFACLTLNAGFTFSPDYTTPLDDPGGALSQSGAVAHTWQTSGQYRVRLTTIDQAGRSTAYTFTVTVADQSPSITEDVFLRGYPAGAPFYPGMIYGQIKHYGTNDDEIVTLNWGDGSTDTATIGPRFVGPGGLHLGVGGVYNPPSDLTLTADNTGNFPIINYAYSGPHTYARGGIYHVTVSVLDQGGLTASQTQDVTIYNPQAVANSLAPLSAPIGSSPTVTITGSNFVPGASVQVNGSPISTTYVSGSEVTAQIPATETASLAVDTITVENPAPDFGPSNPRILYIVPAQSPVAAANVATNSDPNGSATATVGGSGTGTMGSLSAATNGTGAVAVAQFTGDPVDTTPPPGVNAYFDVVVPAGNSADSVQVTDCNLGGGSVVYAYDSTTKQWTSVSGQSYDASAGCVTFTLDGGSAPSLTQLSGGTIFGVRNVPPVVTNPGPQSVRYGGQVSVPVSATDVEAADKLTLRASGLPAGLSFTDNGNGTGTVSGTVTAPVGPYTATLSANDGLSDSTPGTVAFTVKPAPLTITAADQTTPYGTVPATYPWTGSGWVNGESATALTTPPTCAATVGDAALTATTAPGIYAGAITCRGAADPNYAITYAGATLTVDPLILLDERGLPGTVLHQATLDSQAVTLPLPVTKQEVAYGSAHSYSFPATVTDPGSGAVYITNDAGFSGTVTVNRSDTASYQTVAQAVAAAFNSGGIDSGGVANALTQQFAAVQADIKAGATARALADLHTFAALVRAQAGKHIAAATAQALLADALLVYASLGGTGSV